MGGPGSGQYYHWNEGKPLTNAQPTLCVNYLNRRGYLRPGCLWAVAWSRRDEAAGSIGGYTTQDRVTLLYKWRRNGEEWQITKQIIPLAWTPCTYGGRRPWFVCSCGRRVGKLYGSWQLFKCRHCYDLAYSSQRSTDPDRLTDRAYQLRRRLWERMSSEQRKQDGGVCLRADEWIPRPKGMHWKTWHRYRDEIQKLELLSLRMIVARFDLHAASR